MSAKFTLVAGLNRTGFGPGSLQGWRLQGSLPVSEGFVFPLSVFLDWDCPGVPSCSLGGGGRTGLPGDGAGSLPGLRAWVGVGGLTECDLPVAFGVLGELLLAELEEGLQVLRLRGDSLGSVLPALPDEAVPHGEARHRVLAEGEHALELVELGAELLYLVVPLLQEDLEVVDLVLFLHQCHLQLLHRPHVALCVVAGYWEGTGGTMLLVFTFPHSFLKLERHLQ